MYLINKIHYYKMLTAVSGILIMRKNLRNYPRDRVLQVSVSRRAKALVIL